MMAKQFDILYFDPMSGSKCATDLLVVILMKRLIYEFRVQDVAPPMLARQVDILYFDQMSANKCATNLLVIILMKRLIYELCVQVVCSTCNVGQTSRHSILWLNERK